MPPERRIGHWSRLHNCKKLDSRGVRLSEVRAGRKPGTRVTTLKSRDLGIPTLLIEPAA